MRPFESPLTPEAFADLVEQAINSDLDEERLHMRTDELMEEMLLRLGYWKGVALVRSQKRWYA